MNISDIVQDIIEIVLEEEWEAECDEVIPDALLEEDLMIGSSERTKIALALESEFNIVLTADIIGSWVTVKNIVDSVQLMLKIAFHEKRIELHRSAIKKLEKEKSVLIMNGGDSKNENIRCKK